MTGSLPSAALMRKLLLTVAAAVLWFLPAHFALLALLVFVWGSAMATTTNTAKARGTEARLTAHIAATAPAVNLVANGGTIGGSLTVSGNHSVTGDTHIGGNLYGSGGTLPVPDNIHASGSANLVNGLNVSGFTNTATLQVNSHLMSIPFADEGDQTSLTLAAFNALLDRLRGSGLMA